MNDQLNTPQELVMLVDDSEIDCYINKFIINDISESINIISFYDAIKALNYLFENPNDISKIPDIIFLDIHMPIMDGFDFLEEYENCSTNILNKTTVYILSSSFDPQDLNRANKNKYVKEFIEKPLTDLKFKKIFESLLTSQIVKND